MSRSEISLNEAAVSSRKLSSSRESPSRPSKWRWVKGPAVCVMFYGPLPVGSLRAARSDTCLSLLGAGDDDFVAPVALHEPDLHRLGHRGWQILAHVVGPDRQLAMTAIHQDDQLHVVWPAEIHQGIERGADG